MLRQSWVSLLFVSAISSIASNAFADSERDLRASFDAYNVAAGAGNVNQMLALRTSAMAKQIRRQTKGSRDRAHFITIARAQIPMSYETQHIDWSKDGKRAELFLLLHLPPMMEIGRPRAVSMEVMIAFGKEDGRWKMDHLLALGNPDEIVRPQDLLYNPEDANTNITSASVAGRIVRFEFKPDHTLVMVRVMNEEIAVFLPKKEALEEAGVQFEALAPWKMREFTGYPHKKDALKFFATGDNSVE